MAYYKFLCKAWLVLCFSNTIVNKANAQFEAAYKVNYPERYYTLFVLSETYEKSKQNKPKKSFENLVELAKKNNDNRGLWLAEFYDLKYKIINGFDDDPTIKKRFEALIQSAQKQGFKNLEAYCILHQGHYYFVTKKIFGVGFKYYLQAYDLYKNISEGDFFEKQYALNTYATAHYRFGDYKKALPLATMAAKTPTKMMIGVLYNYDLLGAIYKNLQNYDSARFWYSKCFDAISYKDAPTYLPVWVGIANSNIGETYILENKYDSAMPFLIKAIPSLVQLDLGNCTAANYAKIAKIQLYKKQYTALDSTLPLIKQYMRNQGKDADINTIYNYFGLQLQYNKAINNTNEAYAVLDSFLFYKDSLAHKFDKNLQTTAQLDFETEKSKLKEDLLQSQLKISTLTRNALIILSILAIAIFILLYNRSQLKTKHKQKLLEDEKNAATIELKKAATQLEIFKQNIVEKNIIIEKFTEEIENINKEKGGQLSPQQIDSINELRQFAILTDTDWQNFQQLYEKAYKGFFIKLKAQYTNLTPAETRFIALTQLQLSNKEMAAIMGVSLETIRSVNSRLRKKIGISADVKFNDLLLEANIITT